VLAAAGIEAEAPAAAAAGVGAEARPASSLLPLLAQFPASHPPSMR
jgi:hypothetical protein